jgi:hypothetical protein
MNGKASLSLCLWVSLLLAACRFLPSPDDVEATRVAVAQATRAVRETEVAAAIYATETAEAPTSTPTPTNTPTPTVTPTPTSTPTPTPTFTPKPTRTPTMTPTATPTSVPTPDWSGMVLIAKDLPDRFWEMPPEALSFGPGNPSMVSLAPIETAFMLMDEVGNEAVSGFTVMLPTRAEQIDFDEQMSMYAKAISLGIAVGTGVEDLPEPQELPDLQIGDASTGIAMEMPVEDTGAVHLEAVLFRRDKVGAFLFTICMSDQDPTLSIVDLARTLDERIVAALAANDR